MIYVSMVSIIIQTETVGAGSVRKVYEEDKKKNNTNRFYKVEG